MSALSTYLGHKGIQVTKIYLRLTKHYFIDVLKYSINEAGLSNDTVKSYRDTFVLFLKYLDERGTCKLKSLDISVFTEDTITDFLNWIETNRQCSINTRNKRLAVINSFISYVLRRSPEDYKDYQDILSICIKKAL